MKIERMVLGFPDLRNVIVDNEGHLQNYNLDRCVGIDVRVSMDMEEFRAFREWKAQFRELPKERKLLEAKGDYLERFDTI